MAREFRVVGPPGCGKTFYLTQQARRAVEKHGPDRVVVCSLTKAAAREAAGRGSGVTRQNIGTLHSLCYRMIGAPPLVDGKFVAAWNDAHKLTPISSTCGSVSVEKGEAMDVGEGSASGDALLREAELLRARCVPQASWDARVLAFHDEWEAAKRDAGMVDFTDMIDLAPDEPPAGTRVLLVDEAQDHSALEMRKLRAWAEHVDTLVIVGDPDQALYSWRGSDPLVFDGELHKVLGQSWRVPRAVQRHARRIIGYCTTARHDISYEPRDEEGELRDTNATCRSPEPLIEVMKNLPDQETLMILASCDFMLDATKNLMRAHGLPYHNPYTHRWNPLGERSIARVRALLRFAAPRWGGPDPHDFVWTLPELREIMPLLVGARSLDDDTGAMLHGSSAALEALGDATDEAQLRRWVRDHVARRAVAALLEGDLDWIVPNLRAQYRTALRYPLDVVTHRGWGALLEKPRVILGTVHCSPPDEQILTRRGYVPVAGLREDDRLVSWHRGTNRILGIGGDKGKSGYRFERSERHHDGNLVVIESDGSRTRVTPNHRVAVRFNDETFCERWAVYLMRKGNWWRCGICTTAHRPYRSGGVSGRLATEQADDGWILSVHDSRRDALRAEATIQAAYGIPGLTFMASSQRSLSTRDLEAVHESASAAVAARVERLFLDTGLSDEWPLYSRGIDEDGKTKRNLRGNFVTAAANLVPLSGRFMVLQAAKMKPEYAPATATLEPYSGPVYGLDVAPYHYYVSGGIVVHNSVKGGEAEHVVMFPDLSAAGARQLGTLGWAERDAIFRMFYVGATRASKSLTIARPASDLASRNIASSRGVKHG